MNDLLPHEDLKIRVLAARLRFLVMQLDAKTFKSLEDYADIFALDDMSVRDFLEGELKLRHEYETALHRLAAKGNVGARQAVSTVNKQFQVGELEALMK